MTEIDTDAERDKAAEAVRTYHRCGFVGDMEHAAATVPAMADHIDRLRAENQRLADLNRRAMAIIADAIMHGMPITEEVAAVRNGIVRGEEHLPQEAANATDT